MFHTELRRIFVHPFRAIAATLPTLFVGHQLGPHFRTWLLAAGPIQLSSYALAFLAATLLFLVLYRVLPNARQHLADVWPGALVAGGLFVLLGQAFPLYLRFVGGSNRYGAGLGLVWLLVTWFGALAHILLFGTFVNVSYHRRRHPKWRPRPAAPQPTAISASHARTASRHSLPLPIRRVVGSRACVSSSRRKSRHPQGDCRGRATDRCRPVPLATPEGGNCWVVGPRDAPSPARGGARSTQNSTRGDSYCRRYRSNCSRRSSHRAAHRGAAPPPG